MSDSRDWDEPLPIRRRRFDMKAIDEFIVTLYFLMKNTLSLLRFHKESSEYPMRAMWFFSRTVKTAATVIAGKISQLERDCFQFFKL